jgi:transcription elongation factor Elf1
MFRGRRQQKKIFLCFYCNTPSTLEIDRNVPLRKWFCQTCEQTNHLDEVRNPRRATPSQLLLSGLESYLTFVER